MSGGSSRKIVYLWRRMIDRRAYTSSKFLIRDVWASGRTGMIAGDDLWRALVVFWRLLQKCRWVDVQCRRQSIQSQDDGAVFHELICSLEAVSLSLTIDDEVDVELLTWRHDLLGALSVAVLSDHWRRGVCAVTNHNEIWTVWTAAQHNVPPTIRRHLSK